MKLAMRIGCTLRELPTRMDLSEFRLWMQLDKLSPIGDERYDILNAINSHATVFPHLQSGSDVKIGTFIPNWHEQQRRERVDAAVETAFLARGIKKNNG